jgi:signal transduction histidine kinase
MKLCISHVMENKLVMKGRNATKNLLPKFNTVLSAVVTITCILASVRSKLNSIVTCMTRDGVWIGNWIY